MSEKRFSVVDDGIYDTQEKKHFKFIAYDWMECYIYECCEKLNEQQATIDRLKNAIRIAYEEKPYPTIKDIKNKFKELQE